MSLTTNKLIKGLRQRAVYYQTLEALNATSLRTRNDLDIFEDDFEAIARSVAYRG